ncbi:hypothetical protein H2200_000450 [Cladophialophora chaetospira]|uniref:Heterokaryon incompatibility domain-containing protein n=1 Tax=Cladophialophora chaetospira TaxID=386627 RepID=A0AA38XPA6_9EURO|nr:hypothetical protein H2200_000450 [Cladophialophora chaetospira]
MPFEATFKVVSSSRYTDFIHRIEAQHLVKNKRIFDPGCVLCAAMLHAATSVGITTSEIANIGIDLRALKTHGYQGLDTAQVPDWSNVALAVCDPFAKNSVSYTETMRGGWLVPGTEPEIGSYAGIYQPYIRSYGFMRKWLHRCLNSHECDKNAPDWQRSARKLTPQPLAAAFHQNQYSDRDRFATNYFSIHVIDCRTRSIVPMPPNSCYFALSYVWGQSVTMCDGTPSTPETETFVPSPAPHTIDDAMMVVKRLGHRYLWVDRYCIMDDKDKHVQIRAMDRIYSQATATIVALEGSDAEVGLVGVSSPRVAQDWVTTPVGIFASAPPHLSYVIQRSTWGDRAWTYQEHMLSRRCIFFTQYGVYCVCGNNILEEFVSERLSDRWKRSRQDRPGPGLLSGQIIYQHDYASRKVAPKNVSESFNEILAAYTKRKITYDTDILNAPRGILSVYHQHSFWGVPFLYFETPSSLLDHHSVDTAFCRGLCWRVNGASQGRRIGFPTWSWTSLKGTVYIEDAFFGRYTASCSLKIDAHTSRTLYALLHESKLNGSMALPEESQILILHSYIVEVQVIEAQAVFTDTSGSNQLTLGHVDPDEDAVECSRNHDARPMLIAVLLYSGLFSLSMWMVVEKHGRIHHRIGILKAQGVRYEQAPFVKDFIEIH